jgi:hypothetical protein
MNTPEGRAVTGEQKKAVLKDLMAAWSIPPDMRLGQLIYNAVNELLVSKGFLASEKEVANFIFYVEDEKLALIVYQWVEAHYAS